MNSQAVSIMEDESPKVWVECLASYNAGESVGRWVNVPETVEEMQEEINKVLKSSRQPFAEEWAFHCHEYFEPFEVSEWESLDSLVKKANIIKQIDDIEAFKHWDFDNHDFESMSEEEIIEAFQDEFLGVYEDEEDFAYYDMNECNDIPQHLSYYIDYSAYWRDLNHDGYYAHHAGYKECYIYRR